MDIAYDCTKISYAACRGLHDKSTVKIYRKTTGSLAKLCSFQYEGSLKGMYGWGELELANDNIACTHICIKCQREFTALLDQTFALICPHCNEIN